MMAEVNRICPACGKNSPMDARHCPHCGNDTSAGVPMRQNTLLPATVTKAALPVMVTAGTLALRMLWKLVRQQLLSPAPPAVSTANRSVPQTSQSESPARRNGRSIRIRTAWAVGDANGIQRQGYSDQQIDFDE
jgi:hypothetical protein